MTRRISSYIAGIDPRVLVDGQNFPHQIHLPEMRTPELSSEIGLMVVVHSALRLRIDVVLS
jgi:hypothetical protein